MQNIQNIQLSQQMVAMGILPSSSSSNPGDIRLSEHFRLSEFTRSATASARGIDNTPPTEVIVALTALCHNVLEPLRRAMGCPITISSGYRCPKLNKAVGGATCSQHMMGEAADIHLPSTATGQKWFELLKKLPHDQLIWERNSPTSTSYWIHVSCRVDTSRNRSQVIPLLTKN